jgi:hypothetical protein
MVSLLVDDVKSERSAGGVAAQQERRTLAPQGKPHRFEVHQMRGSSNFHIAF